MVSPIEAMVDKACGVDDSPPVWSEEEILLGVADAAIAFIDNPTEDSRLKLAAAVGDWKAIGG